MACPGGTFSTGVACVACTMLTCPVNFSVVACSDAADAYCRPCEASPVPSYRFTFGRECQVIPKYPCPPGYYGLDDCYPCSSVSPLQLPGYGACQCLGVALGVGGICEIASPLPEMLKLLPMSSSMGSLAAGPLKGTPAREMRLKPSDFLFHSPQPTS